MPDVLDDYAIFEHAVEDFEWVPDKRHDVHTRPLIELRCVQWVLANSVNDPSDPRFKRPRYVSAKCASAFCRYLPEIGDDAI